MNSENIIELIDIYFDGELKKDKEIYLFSELSANSEARKYFKRCNALKNMIQSGKEEFPNILDEKILRKVGDIGENSFLSFMSRNVHAIVSYAVTVVLIVVSLYLYSQSGNYKERLHETTFQIKTQNKLINMLYNSLPTAEVKTTVDYKVIVTDEL
jgi:hypothetical protein